MSSSPQKTLQVFVSSTYKDLIAERQAAIEAILDVRYIPTGMERFVAGNKSPMKVIKKWIDQSDVFLLILGKRYGSIEPETGKSFIHLEYEYAIKQNKPCFICVIENNKTEKFSDLENETLQNFKNFRELVDRETNYYTCSDVKDITIEILRNLPRFAEQEDIVGWIRPIEQINNSILQSENIRLKEDSLELYRKISSIRRENQASYLKIRRNYQDIVRELLENTKSSIWISLRTASIVHELLPEFQALLDRGCRVKIIMCKKDKEDLIQTIYRNSKHSRKEINRMFKRSEAAIKELKDDYNSSIEIKQVFFVPQQLIYLTEPKSTDGEGEAFVVPLSFQLVTRESPSIRFNRRQDTELFQHYYNQISKMLEYQENENFPESV